MSNNTKQFLKRKLRGRQGQALFEFIIFMPFFLMLFAVVLNISSSINGSINQQKIVRGYFFHRTSHNSMIPRTFYLTQFKDRGRSSIGYFAYGWREKSIGIRPVSPCYKIHQPLMMGGPKETCEDPAGAGTDGESTTEFVRLFTVFGVCTGLFQPFQGGDVFLLDMLNGGFAGACSLQ